MCLRMHAHRKSPPIMGGRAMGEGVGPRFHAVKHERARVGAWVYACVRMRASHSRWHSR